MVSNKRWIAFFIIWVFISLSMGCEGERRSIEVRCDYDGVKIEPLYAVYITLQNGTEKKFCSIACASMNFPALKQQIGGVRVIDEPSGDKINAAEAFFVESDIVTVPHVRNRIHAYAKKEDALRHIQKFKGNWIKNPFIP